MKKIQHIITLLIAVIALSACTLEQENLFSETPSERSNKEMEKVRELLTSASNGWCMDYFGELNYGGYNVLLQFKDDSVTVASEQAGSGHKAGLDATGKCITARSHYKLEQSMGIVLSMDEYNEIFHYFSMPNNPDYGTKDEGFYGDFEFRVIKADKDSIIMKGKKHNDRIVMTPVPDGTTWESIIKDAADTQEFIDSRNYTLEGEDFDKTVVGIKQYHSFVFQYRNEFDELQTVYCPFVSKKDGYHFYRPTEVCGVTIDGVLKGETRNKFILANNDKMWLYPYLPTLYEHLTGTNSNWFISYKNLGTYGQQMWDKFKTDIKKSGKEEKDLEVLWAYFGKTTKEGVCMLVHLSNGTELIVGYDSKATNEAESEIEMKWVLSKFNKDGKNYYQKGWGFDSAIDPFFGKKGRNFKLETDNQRDPSYLRLIDKDDPTNVITLLATTVYYPFNN